MIKLLGTSNKLSADIQDKVILGFCVMSYIQVGMKSEWNDNHQDKLNVHYMCAPFPPMSNILLFKCICVIVSIHIDVTLLCPARKPFKSKSS